MDVTLGDVLSGFRAYDLPQVGKEAGRRESTGDGLSVPSGEKAKTYSLPARFRSMVFLSD
jgi:hypothetical protein